MVTIGAFLNGKLVGYTTVPNTPEYIAMAKRILQDSYGPDAQIFRKKDGASAK